MIPSTAEIRKFLTKRFSDEELTTFCFDYFRDVYDDFAASQTKGQKIQLLLDFCERRELLPNLQAALQRKYSKQVVEKSPSVSPVRTSPKPERNSRQIFISYAHQDETFAWQLANDLVQRDWQIWISPKSIHPGELWVDAIQRGLDESGIVIVLVTSAAVESEWVKFEMNVAIALERQKVIRLFVIGLEARNMPTLWGAYQYVSFRDQYMRGMTELATALETAPKSSISPVAPVAVPVTEGNPRQTAQVSGETPLHVFRVNSKVNSVAFSPSNKLLTVGLSNGTIPIWQIEDEMIWRWLKYRRPLVEGLIPIMKSPL